MFCVDVIELSIDIELCFIENCEVIIDSSNVVDPWVKTVFFEKIIILISFFY
jgi:hypothetical protein